MNRREFITTSTKLALLSTSLSLFSKEFDFSEEFSPKDSISTKHEIFNVKDRYLEEVFLNAFGSKI